MKDDDDLVKELLSSPRLCLQLLSTYAVLMVSLAVLLSIPSQYLLQYSIFAVCTPLIAFYLLWDYSRKKK